jgi:hypothetical protein
VAFRCKIHHCVGHKALEKVAHEFFVADIALNKTVVGAV